MDRLEKISREDGVKIGERAITHALASVQTMFVASVRGSSVSGLGRGFGAANGWGMDRATEAAARRRTSLDNIAGKGFGSE